MKLHLFIHVSLLLLFAEIFEVVVSWDSDILEYDNLHRNERRVQSYAKSVLNEADKEELSVVSSYVENDIKLIKSDGFHQPDVVDEEDVSSRLFLRNIVDNPVTLKSPKNNLKAIVHIGPQKTGSSSIQQFLNQNLLDVIESDQYETVPGSKRLADYSFVSCFNTKRAPVSKASRYIDYNCHQSVIEDTIKVSMKQNNNLIVTSETIANLNFDISLFQKYINQYWHQGASIIAYYRRFYSWIYSLHNQQTKKIPVPNRKHIVDYVSNIKFIDQIYGAYYFTGTVERFQQYYPNPDSIRLFSLHHDLVNISLMEHFVCVAAPELSNSCTKARQVIQKKGVMHSNTGHDLVYMELAYYAKELNILSPNIINKALDERSLYNDLANAAKNHQELVLQLPIDNFGDVDRTLVCPTSETYQHLLDLTLNTEKKFFPQYYNESDIIHDFQTQYVMKNKFCHVNTTAELYYDLNGWKTFFENLVL